MLRALVFGLILGALSLAALQHITQADLNACKAERLELTEQLSSF